MLHPRFILIESTRTPMIEAQIHVQALRKVRSVDTMTDRIIGLLVCASDIASPNIAVCAHSELLLGRAVMHMVNRALSQVAVGRRSQLQLPFESSVPFFHPLMYVCATATMGRSC